MCVCKREKKKKKEKKKEGACLFLCILRSRQYNIVLFPKKATKDKLQNQVKHNFKSKNKDGSESDI